MVHGVPRAVGSRVPSQGYWLFVCPLGDGESQNRETELDWDPASPAAVTGDVGALWFVLGTGVGRVDDQGLWALHGCWDAGDAWVRPAVMICFC